MTEEVTRYLEQIKDCSSIERILGNFLVPHALSIYPTPEGLIIFANNLGLGSFLTKDEFSTLAEGILNEYMSDLSVKDFNTYRQNRPNVPVERKKKDKRACPGYIYLLESGGYYKIGQSQDVDKRIAQISPKLPLEVKLILTIETNDMDRTETFLHEQFADKRANGEWFRLSREDVASIKKWANEQTSLSPTH